MTLDTIKKLTIKALLHDEKLMYGLVLKGGNALQLIYDITDRASMDIDFSIDGDFSELDKERLHSTIDILLNEQFQSVGFRVLMSNFLKNRNRIKLKSGRGIELNSS